MLFSDPAELLSAFAFGLLLGIFIIKISSIFRVTDSIFDSAVNPDV